MKRCKICFYPENHPLNIIIDDHGVCSGCKVHKEKFTLNWAERFEKLKGIVDQYRDKTGRNYDCIVPISGAQDSFFVIHTVKKNLGLNPLLVSYNKHHNTEIGIRNLAKIRTLLDCDFLQEVINPETIKRINRETFQKIGSIYWHVLAGQTVFPVQVAVKFNIPLIIWGMHQGVDQVGMYSHTDEVEMTRHYRKEHDLMGIEAEDLIGGIESLTEKDLANYRYPSDRDLARVGVRGIYLNNYIPWDPKIQHEKMLEIYGYETFDQARTFDRYYNVDCIHYSGTHDYIKYLKWGYSKIVDHCCREIRHHRLSPAKAINQIKKYIDMLPQDMPALLAFNDLTEEVFYKTIDRFRDPRAWERNNDGRWALTFNWDEALQLACDISENNDGADYIKQANSTYEDIHSQYNLLLKGWDNY